MAFFPGENANLGFAILLTEAYFGIVSSPKIRPRNPDLSSSRSILAYEPRNFLKGGR
jgi:hypothetical protein